MKTLKFIILLLSTYALFYLLIAFLKWDINLLDEIAQYGEARFLVLILLVMGFAITISIYELID